MRLAGSNDVAASIVLEETHANDSRLCQDAELVPHGTAATRLWLQPLHGAGPAVRVTVLLGRRPIAQGARAPGWSGGFVTVRLRPSVPQDVLARICIALAGGRVAVIGAQASTKARPSALRGQMRIEYLRAGHESWWSFAPTVVARMGLGHAWSGPSVALVAALLTLAAWVLGIRELLREQARAG